MSFFGQWLNRTKGLPGKGLHSYTFQTPQERTQVHLRIDSQGSGTLLINANRVLHLNPTAAVMAWLSLEGVPESQALRDLQERFHVPQERVRKDYRALVERIQAAIQPEGACPIHDLEFEMLPPFSVALDAPYRMDLALTYRCNAHCKHCYNARSRNYPELDTPSWKSILDRLWQIGIPHICFTGGEATLREDLPELIRHSQGLGQITGLLTNGISLADPEYVGKLKGAGLDHIQITLESHDRDIHDRMVVCQGAWDQTTQGIRNALDSGMYLMTNTTLLQENGPWLAETLRFLGDLGVPTIGLNALIYAGRGTKVGTGIHESELEPLLEIARDITKEQGQRLIWYTPTQYCHFDPVQFELGVKGCTAARYNMCVEPDGMVIPCQSYYQPLGSMLTDSWEGIWHHELAQWIRDREYIPSSCTDCPVLSECGGGCPLTLANQPETAPVLDQILLNHRA